MAIKRTSKAAKTDKETADAGKPLAKSSDPAFTKFTTYIRKATHLAVKVRMVGEERELSDLVEELLSEWLTENGSNGH